MKLRKEDFDFVLLLSNDSLNSSGMPVSYNSSQYVRVSANKYFRPYELSRDVTNEGSYVLTKSMKRTILVWKVPESCCCCYNLVIIFLLSSSIFLTF